MRIFRKILFCGNLLEEAALKYKNQIPCSWGYKERRNELPGKTSDDYDSGRNYWNFFVSNICKIFSGAVSSDSNLSSVMDHSPSVSSCMGSESKAQRAVKNAQEDSGSVRNQWNFFGFSFFYLV